ncbi:hypothetical protein, partial [Halogeometricum pallidum]|uniref:hypothetical protein n=1 Tax=Halogeometricum pallidum TaxID=411361 RepID=UPI0019552B0F
MTHGLAAGRPTPPRGIEAFSRPRAGAGSAVNAGADRTARTYTRPDAESPFMTDTDDYDRRTLLR